MIYLLWNEWRLGCFVMFGYVEYEVVCVFDFGELFCWGGGCFGFYCGYCVI